MGVPTTIQQLVVIVVAVLPGIVYQFVRERVRGRVARDDNVAERVLRAVTAGIVLDTVYLLAAGPWLAELVGGGALSPIQTLSARPREIALVAAGLMVVVPAAAAALVNLVQQRRSGTDARYRGTGTSWAHLFSRRAPCFVRIRLSDGTWVGGWYGNRSLASAHPGEGEVYLESSYRMGPDGTFGARVTNTGGVLVRADAVQILEIVEPGPGPGTTGGDAKGDDDARQAA